MRRWRALSMAVAIAGGAGTMLTLSPGEAGGQKSEPGLQGNDRIELCHLDFDETFTVIGTKAIKVYPSDLDEHLAHGDLVGKCPKA